MEAPDNLEVSRMVSDAVRAAVAVQSDTLNHMLADDAIAAVEEQSEHAGSGSGMDDFSTGGGGGGYAGPWRLDVGENATYLRDNYYNAGGKTSRADDIDVTSLMTSGFLAVIFEGQGNCSVNLYQSLTALQSAQNDEDTYILPLYLLGNGEVVLDMRNTPHLQVFEGSL